MQHKDERAWMLQNVVAAAKLPSVANVYHRDDNGVVHLMKEQTTPQLPTLIGKVNALALPSCAGLPSYLTIEERNALQLAINQSVAGSLIEWEGPIVVGSAITLTLENRQEPKHTRKRLVKITLRALRTFQGKLSYDNIKVLLEEDQGTKFYFGRCLLFFQDNKGNVFVAIRWYTNHMPNGEEIDPTVRLVKLKLAPLHNVSRANIHGISTISTLCDEV
jgi:hypothetical protein